MNRIRVVTSGALFLFAIYCCIYEPTLPFTLPHWIYMISFLYFAFFPIKDMCAIGSRSLYKGRQYQKNYVRNPQLQRASFQELIKINNRRAFHSFLFWMLFMSVPCTLYILGILHKVWIFFFFALSNFSVFYAIFGWCPFHSIFIRPSCCMECRIYNWDSFFQYSFLLFLPHPLTITLFLLGLCSLIKWEYMHYHHPEHFYKMSNQTLTCQNCDLDNCRKHKKKLFHTTLREEYQNKSE